MTPHVIRLLGPWQFRVLSRTDDDADIASKNDLPSSGRLKVPCDWTSVLGNNFQGSVRFVRSFGCPTNLDRNERVDLVVEKISGNGTVSLNDQDLGTIPSSSPSWRYDVTCLLRPRNELRIDVDSEVGPGGITGNVQLEIST